MALKFFKTIKGTTTPAVCSLRRPKHITDSPKIPFIPQSANSRFLSAQRSAVFCHRCTEKRVSGAAASTQEQGAEGGEGEQSGRWLRDEGVADAVESDVGTGA